MDPGQLLGDSEGGIGGGLSDEGLVDLIWHVNSLLVGFSSGYGVQAEF